MENILKPVSPQIGGWCQRLRLIKSICKITDYSSFGEIQLYLRLEGWRGQQLCHSRCLLSSGGLSLRYFIIKCHSVFGTRNRKNRGRTSKNRKSPGTSKSPWCLRHLPGPWSWRASGGRGGETGSTSLGRCPGSPWLGDPELSRNNHWTPGMKSSKWNSLFVICRPVF